MPEEICREFFSLNNHLVKAADFKHLFNPPTAYIYEVFRLSQQVPLFIEDHLERFFTTAKLSGVETATGTKEMMGLIHHVISNNPPGDGNMKLALYYNSESKRQLFIYFTPHQYPSPQQYDEGVDVELYQAERENPNAKVMHPVMRQLTDDIKHEHQVYEVLLVDSEGFVTEGSRSNVFFIKDDRVITPPADTVLEGITRKQIVYLCHLHHIPCNEAKVHQGELTEFDALLISGTSRRVLPVKKVNDHNFAPAHPLIIKLQALFEGMVTDYIAKKLDLLKF